MVFRKLIFARFYETRTTRPLQIACLVKFFTEALNSSVQLLKGVRVNGTVCISATHNR